MPSTPSSAEDHRRLSATETLASRYRHLFVLPTTSTLVLCSAVTSAVLAFESRGTSGVIFFLLTFAVFLFAAAAVSSALLIADGTTIADFRRTCAVLFVGDVLWIAFVSCGIALGSLAAFPSALTNAFVFGSFTAAGFEFLVFDAVFTDRAWLAMVLSAIHPTTALLVLRSPELSSTPLDPLLLLFGISAFSIIACFALYLERRKTAVGYNVLDLFRAFVKTWAAGDKADLERIIADHSEEAEVTTKVIRFQSRAGNLFLVFPGVHPGPFYPIGSYDFPGVISRAFKGHGAVLTFHRPGGHERNLATNEETERYATEICEHALAINPAIAGADMKGPIHTNIGTAKVSAIAFSEEAILTISFAPLGSDDLEVEAETELWAEARTAGLDLSVVDAHNSLVDVQESLECADAGWRQLFDQVKAAEALEFKIGYANSAELGFGTRGDLTENGISLIMFDSKHGKSVLVLADANNAVPPLRAETSKALGSLGYELIEFCTSDSHNLAAKGLTVSRGYKALGEATSIEVLTKLVSDLAKLAETRLSQCSHGYCQLTSTVRIFGKDALEAFAAITQSTSNTAKTYLKGAATAVIILLLLSLVL